MKINSLYCLDYLSVSISLNQLFFEENLEKYEFHSTILVLTNRKTSNFKKIYDVLINGLCFAELRTDCNKNQLEVGHSVIKFKNELLYSGQLYSIYKRIKKDLNFRFIKINQIDVALDQSAKDQKHIKFATDYMQGKIDFIGNQNIRIDSKHHKIRNIYIGQRSSGKFLRCYYKKQELEVSNKRYIIDYWQLNNLDIENEIFRCELSISGSLTNKIYIPDLSENGSVYLPFLEEKTLSIIQRREFLHALFYRETKDFCKTLKTKELKEKKRTNLCVQKYIFEHCQQNIKPIFLLERIKENTSKVIHKIKMCSKFLTEIAIETGENLYELMSDELCNFESLFRWKENKKDRWIKEHYKKIQNPIYKRYLSALNIFDTNTATIKQDLEVYKSRAEQFEDDCVKLKNILNFNQNMFNYATQLPF